MDGPFESARTATAMRLINAALTRGHNVRVFAYEGAVSLSFVRQSQHANAVHGNDISEENHPLPKDWIASLFRIAEANSGKFEWVNCGLCVDERGVGEAVEGVIRGTPADLWAFASSSANTVVIPTAGG